MRNLDIDAIDEALERYPLPFVDLTPGEVNFWKAEGVGHDETDFGTGELYATIAIKAAKECGGPYLLAMILRDMVRNGQFAGVEAGFLATVAGVARAGSMH